MTKIIYGAWGQKIFDGRKSEAATQDLPELQEFSNFGDKKIKAFVGQKGFFVFDESASLVNAFRSYLKKVCDETCGKCTPCRVGNRVLLDKFDKIIEGKGTEADLSEIKKLAEHVATTSLCGLGKTSTVALTKLLENFEEELIKEIKKPAVTKESTHSYVTAPCIEACPARVDIPKYVQYVGEGKLKESVGVVLKEYPLAASCGRVCVRFCEDACARNSIDKAVAIKPLKRVVADEFLGATKEWFNKDIVDAKKGKNIAIVGAGPAGLTCAYQLLLKGYDVEIFEALKDAGGMARVGIPNYRLPADVLTTEVEIIQNLGGKIHFGKRLGKDITLADLKSKYNSVFLGIGAHNGKSIRAEGEDPTLEGYMHGVSYLLDVNNATNHGRDMGLKGKVFVVGGGNVAMDCVRSAKRLGAEEVHLIYRRTEKEMPADYEEIEAMHKEGIIVHELTHPVKILSENGKITGLELVKMELTEPERPGGRRGVKAVEGSNFTLDADILIPAIGQSIDLTGVEGIEVTKWGSIVTDNNLMTGLENVFAGGDCQIGPATLIEAMAHGKTAADNIDEYLSSGKIEFKANEKLSQLTQLVTELEKHEFQVPMLSAERKHFAELDPEERTKNFEEVEMCMTKDDAYLEADRCLRCYRVSMVVTE